MISIIKHYQLRDDLLYCTSTLPHWENARILVLGEAMRNQIVKQHQDLPLSGYFGAKSTYEKIHRQYYWPNMVRQISKYVQQCQICQQTKPSNIQPCGLVQSLKVPTRPRQQVSMDFISDLPISKNAIDSVMVVVDRLP